MVATKYDDLQAFAEKCRLTANKVNAVEDETRVHGKQINMLQICMAINFLLTVTCACQGWWWVTVSYSRPTVVHATYWESGESGAKMHLESHETGRGPTHDPEQFATAASSDQQPSPHTPSHFSLEPLHANDKLNTQLRRMNKPTRHEPPISKRVDRQSTSVANKQERSRRGSSSNLNGVDLALHEMQTHHRHRHLKYNEPNNEPELSTVVDARKLAALKNEEFLQDITTTSEAVATIDGQKYAALSKCRDNPILSPIDTTSGDDYKFNSRTFQTLSMAQHVLYDDIPLWRSQSDSASYDAVCWILYDDAQQMMPTDDHFVQRLVMALFYFSTKSYETDRYREPFQASKDETMWFNVTEHDGDGGHIRDLTVPPQPAVSAGLRGTLLPELAHLSHLEQLILQGNNLRGTIPEEYGQLSNLKNLDLGFNYLSGTIPDRFFEGATKLQQLRVNNNRLTGLFPSHIGHISSTLFMLHMEHNLFSGSIPEEVFDCKLLEGLWLHDNALTGTIPSRVGELLHIDKFAAQKNSLSGPLPSELGKVESLRLLDLSQNRLSGNIPFEIWSLPFDQDLGRIYLEGNQLNGIVPDHFCEKMKDARRRIQVDCSRFFGEPKVQCPCCERCDEVHKLSSYASRECKGAKLELHFNGTRVPDWSLRGVNSSSTQERLISDRESNGWNENNTKPSMCVSPTSCMRLLVNNLTKVAHVRVLSDGNEVLNVETDGKEVLYINLFPQVIPGIQLPHDPLAGVRHEYEFFFGYNISTVEFDESSCSLVSEMMCGDSTDITVSEANRSAVLDHLVEYSELGRGVMSERATLRRQALCNVASHNFGNADAEDVLNGTAYQRYLCTILSLQNGAWSNKDLDEVAICDWKGVTCDPSGFAIGIDLNGSILRGTLPQELGGLRSLNVLNFSNTTLSGIIPPQLSNLPDLSALDLSNNFLSGSIPDLLPTQLQFLDVSNNLLAGTLSDNIGSIASLESLIAAQNLIHGTIPDAISSLVELKVIDFSSNKLSGSVPDSIFNSLKNLIILKLNGNALSGRLSSSVADLGNLRYLYLQDNLLSGTLPSLLFSDTSHLAIVKLNSNALRGDVPDTISEAKHLSILHIQDNSLSGTVSRLPNAPRATGNYHYIADCVADFGEESATIECNDCQICCNSDQECYEQGEQKMSVSAQIGIIVGSIVGLTVLCFFCFYPHQRRKLVQGRPIINRSPMDLCGKGSVYCLLLAGDWRGTALYGFTVFLQLGVFSLFIYSALMEQKMLPLFLTCPPDSDECEDVRTVDPFGWITLAVLMAVYLTLDVVNGFTLVIRSGTLRSPRLLISGSSLVIISVMVVWTSVYYNAKTAVTNTDLIVNAVVVLFVNEIDEHLFVITSGLFPQWTKELYQSAEAFCSELESKSTTSDVIHVESSLDPTSPPISPR